MLMTMACFYELLVTLARLYRKGSEKVGAVASSGFLLSDIISFLNAHYAENISIDKLAQEAYVSPRTFHRLFTAATGMPPKQYLLHLRVNRALSMLLHTNRTIKEIALSCGFSNSTHFYQRFTKLTGKGPLEMRRSRAEHMPHDV